MIFVILTEPDFILIKLIIFSKKIGTILSRSKQIWRAEWIERAEKIHFFWLLNLLQIAPKSPQLAISFLTSQQTRTHPPKTIFFQLHLPHTSDLTEKQHPKSRPHLSFEQQTGRLLHLPHYRCHSQKLQSSANLFPFSFLHSPLLAAQPMPNRTRPVPSRHADKWPVVPPAFADLPRHVTAHSQFNRKLHWNLRFASRRRSRKRHRCSLLLATHPFVTATAFRHPCSLSLHTETHSTHPVPALEVLAGTSFFYSDFCSIWIFLSSFLSIFSNEHMELICPMNFLLSIIAVHSGFCDSFYFLFGLSLRWWLSCFLQDNWQLLIKYVSYGSFWVNGMRFVLL